MGTYFGGNPPGAIHIVLQNANGIANNKQGAVKLDCLHLFMEEQEIDIMAMMELNTAWDCLDYRNRLPAKTCRLWEANLWSVVHNKQDKYGDDFQPGGTMIVVLNTLSHRTTTPGDDVTGLRQWSWVRLRGKEDHFLQVVLLYCPCKSDGHLTTYQQHIWWFSCQGKAVCPRKQILEDLQAQVEQWQSNGDMVLILADINEDIHLEPITSTFRDMGLVEATTAIHGNNGPNTHNRGQTPLDGIIFPHGLLHLIIMAGYYALGVGIPSLYG